MALDSSDSLSFGQQVLARGGLRFVDDPTPLLPPRQVNLQPLGQEFPTVTIIFLNSFYKKKIKNHKTMFPASPLVP